MHRPCRCVALFGLFLAAACGAGAGDGDDDGQPPVTRQNPVIAMDTGTVRVVADADTFRLSVEIAETADQRQVGLQERDDLPEDEGMLFLMDEERPGTSGFWMYRTRIPLDIAYADSAGAIVSIRRMEPCTAQFSSDCPLYPPDAPYWMTLETVAGWFDEHGVVVGDTIALVSREGGPAGEAG